MSPKGKNYISYNTIHKIVQKASEKIAEFKPDIILAIGGGGFIPARILRTFINNAPILAIGLRLYDSSDKPIDAPEIVQWLDEKNAAAIKGKRVLIVDEVDDSRATLLCCVELVRKHLASEIGVMVVHNKLKPKRGEFPSDVKYFAGQDIEDMWVVYPWDAKDIDEHERLTNVQS